MTGLAVCTGQTVAGSQSAVVVVDSHSAVGMTAAVAGPVDSQSKTGSFPGVTAYK